MIVLFLVVIMVWAVVLNVIDFIAMQSWSKFGTYRYPIEVRDRYQSGHLLVSQGISAHIDTSSN